MDVVWCTVQYAYVSACAVIGCKAYLELGGKLVLVLELGGRLELADRLGQVLVQRHGFELELGQQCVGSL